MIAKREFLELALDDATERLVDRRDASSVETSDPASAELLVSVALGEVLWWLVAFDDAIGGYARNLDPDGKEMRAAFRCARNRLAHGQVVSEIISKGRTYPRTYPIHYGWKWRSLDRPETTKPRWLEQWEAYQCSMVGHDIDDKLNEYRAEVLELPRWQWPSLS